MYHRSVHRALCDMDSSTAPTNRPLALAQDDFCSARPWSTSLLEIYRTKYEQFVRIAQRTLCDRSLAEDCVQDAFVAFHAKQIKPRSGAEVAYLRTMVRNGAVSRVRSEVRRRALDDENARRETGSAEEAALSNLGCAQLEVLVGRLPGRQGQVVRLSLQGLSVDQTALALSISAGTVKTHRHRATAAMRSSLDRIVA